MPEQYEEEPGSEGKRGTVYALLVLTEDAYLKVFERVEVHQSGAHREVYSYALIVEGAHYKSWERDPTHPDEPVHEHDGKERARTPSERISFKEALEQAWEILADRELAPWETEEDLP